MSSRDYGGQIECRFSDGTALSLRGTVNLMTAGRSNEAIVNQDASVDRVMTLQARRFEISFADRGEDWRRLMKDDRFDVTFIERDTGVTHYYTRAFMTGEPAINRINGEVTGLTGAAEVYDRKG